MNPPSRKSGDASRRVAATIMSRRFESMLATTMTTQTLDTLGQHIESRFIDELPVRPVEEFAGLLDLKNLQGDSTGYIKVFSGDRIEKGSSLSIDMMPGHALLQHPHHSGSDLPRPAISVRGHADQVGQPGVDGPVSGYRCADGRRLPARRTSLRSTRSTIPRAVTATLKFEASRQLHMRAFSSPFFLCAFDVAEDKLPQTGRTTPTAISASGSACSSRHRRLEPDSAAARRVRRAHVATDDHSRGSGPRQGRRRLRRSLHAARSKPPACSSDGN